MYICAENMFKNILPTYVHEKKNRLLKTMKNLVGEHHHLIGVFSNQVDDLQKITFVAAIAPGQTKTITLYYSSLQNEFELAVTYRGHSTIVERSWDITYTAVGNSVKDAIYGIADYHLTNHGEYTPLDRTFTYGGKNYTIQLVRSVNNPSTDDEILSQIVGSLTVKLGSTGFTQCPPATILIWNDGGRNLPETIDLSDPVIVTSTTSVMDALVIPRLG